MFFCEECGEKKDWPRFSPRSFGRCEVCGKARPCHDRPHYQLPSAERDYNFDPSTGILTEKTVGSGRRDRGE